MKAILTALFFIIFTQLSSAQGNTDTASSKKISKAEQELLDLSKLKWQWMSDKNVDKLGHFFHEKSVFVHMGGSWGKEQEVNVIKSGGIWYKKADIQEASVNIIGNTAIVLNKITLLAVVGGNEVTNPFMVTEVYVKEGDEWKLGSLSFTKLLTP
ncbi:nuclear transport factor 2 family protein [Flavobacterium aquicola]|uniref:Uncharacterized protein DUF4440 n=1 Tax=Flavobacterium aquicola TaxID=1682742 RepID=A0A3E0ERW3_9FLAO|nr:nuclear transport factor 2 family protein [Flavobacterium aquicola]REH00968.1 uncharacterized protein DUF4440 [Flavobacterium aquicola]